MNLNTFDRRIREVTCFADVQLIILFNGIALFNYLINYLKQIKQITSGENDQPDPS